MAGKKKSEPKAGIVAKPTPKKRGPEPIQVDWDVVDKMLGIQCTQLEICEVLGIHDDTIRARCLEDHGVNYREYSSAKRSAGFASLRHKQWQSAQGGNVRMQIWLGKNWLGQTDRHELSGPGGQPMEFTVDMKKLKTSTLEDIVEAAKEIEEKS